MTDPRDTYRWKQLRARLVGVASTCEECGYPIDHNAPGRSRWSPSLDHVLPVDSYPDLAFEVANLRVIHYGCNARKSARIRNHGPASDTLPRGGAVACPVHGSRRERGCHLKRWIVAGCEIHGSQCPDNPAQHPRPGSG